MDHKLNNDFRDRNYQRMKRRFEKIEEYIARSYGEDLSARAVAKRFELSVSSLQHFFRRFANQSFHKYVEEVRMGKAFELISEGNKRIKEVMYATGYHNRHSFNRAFKDKYGYPPSTFKL